MLPISLLMFTLHSSNFTHSDVGAKQTRTVTRCHQLVAAMLDPIQLYEIKMKTSENLRAVP